ncbi:MAG: hypothetical protein QM709_03470 [Spongiibacteraceae bacterium]
MNAVEPQASVEQQQLSKLKALGLLIAAMAMSAGFIAICGALGNHDFYAGFVFLLCWTVMEKIQVKRLPHSIIGCAFGVLLGYALQYVIGNAVPMGGLIFTAIVMVVLYCQFLGWLPLIANLSMFTMLLVVTIPYIQTQAKFLDVVISLALGVVYFTPIIAGSLHFSAKRKAASAS